MAAAAIFFHLWAALHQGCRTTPPLSEDNIHKLINPLTQHQPGHDSRPPHQLLTRQTNSTHQLPIKTNTSNLTCSRGSKPDHSLRRPGQDSHAMTRPPICHTLSCKPTHRGQAWLLPVFGLKKGPKKPILFNLQSVSLFDQLSVLKSSATNIHQFSNCSYHVYIWTCNKSYFLKEMPYLITQSYQICFFTTTAPLLAVQSEGSFKKFKLPAFCWLFRALWTYRENL